MVQETVKRAKCVLGDILTHPHYPIHLGLKITLRVVRHTVMYMSDYYIACVISVDKDVPGQAILQQFKVFICSHR